jgi:DNA processing protein
MIESEGLAAWLRLTLIPGIGGETQRKLLAAFGLPEAVFAAGRLAARAVVGSRADLLFDFDPAEAVDRSMAWANEPGQSILTLADSAYPRALLEIADPPNVLYVRGNPGLLQKRGLGIVGSRNATPQGLQTAEVFAKALAGAGLSIISGLALGIDAAAHRGALAAGGDTIAVIGTAPTVSTPPATRSLRWRLPNGAPSFPNFRLAHRPSPPTSRVATGSFPDCHAVCWSSKRPLKVVR